VTEGTAMAPRNGPKKRHRQIQFYEIVMTQTDSTDTCDTYIVRVLQVGEVDVVIIECEGRVASVGFRQYSPSSSSIEICCLDPVGRSVAAAAPVHNAS